MKTALKIVGGVVAAGVVAYGAVILYVSWALANAMYTFKIDEDLEE